MAKITSSSAKSGVKKGPNRKEFDKRKWRENTYSHKAKVEKWNENKNNSIKRGYFRMLKKQGATCSAVSLGSKVGEKSASTEEKRLSYKQARLQFESRKRKAEKLQKQEEKRKRFEERKEALISYKKQKAERFKVLSKKTSKGQPHMAGRMEMLFEKIKGSI